jgi:predicted transcriptional regulator
MKRYTDKARMVVMPIQGSYELTVLFLSLSDVTRLKILNRLHEQTSLHDICDEFQLLMHEGVRQLRRLEDVGLVEKLPTGDYILSNFGRIIMPLLEGISNIYGFLEYWETHATSELPHYLKLMPAELYADFIDDSITLSEVSAEIMSTAEKFLWVLNEDTKTDVFKAKDVRILVSTTSGLTTKQSRYVKNIYTQLVLNEYQAKISFPGITTDKELYKDSNSGFLSKSPSAIYCLLKDFFNFLWEFKSIEAPLR